MPLARAVHPLLLLEGEDGVGYEAAVPFVERILRSSETAVRLCEARIAVQRPRLRNRQVDAPPRSSTRRERATRPSGSCPRSAGARGSRSPRSRSRSGGRRGAPSCRSRATSRSSLRTIRGRRRTAAPSRERARGRARRGSARSSPPAAPGPGRTARRGGRRPAGQRSAGRSPPGPFRCGSTTCSVKPAATAASNALPPCSSTAIPAAEASQCVDATIPNVPRSSGRVVNATRRTLEV